MCYPMFGLVSSGGLRLPSRQPLRASAPEQATTRLETTTSRDALGKIDGVATRKVTLSIDHTAWALAEAAAARAGISPSAWLSAAARREAVRLGAGTDWGDSEAEALAQDADLTKAEKELHAAG